MTPPEPEPRVRIDDLSTGRRRFRVTARSESVFDAVLAVWSAFGGNPEADSHEIGPHFFESFRRSVPADTRREMDQIGFLDGSLWSAVLSSLAAEAPAGTNDDILDWLVGVGDFSGALLRAVAADADPADVAEVIDRRDPDSLDRVLSSVKEHARESLVRALAIPPDSSGPRVSAILRSILAEAYAPGEDDWTKAIAASAESTLRMAEAMQPTELIERITNGLDFDIPLGVTRLIVVPSVTLRPWTLITEVGDAVVLAYPVADDDLGSDPDDAPTWVVRFHKALGDEKRLRILREVAGGAVGLGDLTDILGLAKSTVFHHIGILRAAGLLRVRVSHGEGGFRGYELRQDAFADAEDALRRYLDVPARAEGMVR